MKDWIRLDRGDEVVVALRELAAGERLTLEDGSALELLDDIPQGHKVLTAGIDVGGEIHKYGYPIGRAREKLEPGRWIHAHNLGTGLEGEQDYSYSPSAPQPSDLSASGSTFLGYRREFGTVGIRNEIWILSTVGCINKTCETVARRAGELYGSLVDGVFHFPHPYGCSQLGDDLRHTQKLLAALVRHPNAAGVLVMGLGCENNELDSFRQAVGDIDPRRVRYIQSQDAADEIQEGLDAVGELAAYAATFQREPIPVSELKLGLKCGGSDGLSGITANPLSGRMADRLAGAGGTAILTEVPEMFGAETILMNRAVDETVFADIVSLINGFKRYYRSHDQPVTENPSPGNKAGGISTLEEKSLGCTQKGGRSPVTSVIPYGGQASAPGLCLVEAPGNDLVSVTALAAAGAHLILFTTGRGTPFGGPVPTVKISSNSGLAARKRNWIDFDAGTLISGEGMEQLADRLWERILSIASGAEQTLSEVNGFREIAIFKDGVTL